MRYMFWLSVAAVSLWALHVARKRMHAASIIPDTQSATMPGVTVIWPQSGWAAFESRAQRPD